MNIRIHGARLSGSQPVERDALEDSVERWVDISPFQEFFTDPVEGQPGIIA